MLTFDKTIAPTAIFIIVIILTACGGGTSVTPNASAGNELVSISITPTDALVALGTSQDFTATGIYSDNTTQDLTASATWDSSDTTRAMFLSPGHIQGRVVGKTTVTARWGRISGSTTLTVTPATLVSLDITPVNPSIARGTNQQFTATGVFSDNTTQDMTQNVTWSSSNTAIASISNAVGSHGLATSAAAGSSTIVATFGTVSGSTSLSVTSAVLVSLAITPSNPSIALGTSRQFTATGTYSNGSTQDLTAAVTWNSSNTGIASVGNTTGSKGLATSVGTGSVSITTTSGSISASTQLTVTAATLSSLAVTPVNPSIVLGTTRQFTVTGTYSNGSTQDLTATATWSSSSTAVATISNAAGSRGLAASVATGSSTITAASGSVSGSTTLTVTAATLTSLAVTPANPSIVLGTTCQFTATGTYSNGSTQDVTASATWSSVAASVATISNAAGSRGLSTSVAAGSTTITATIGGVSASTLLTVTSATLTSIAVTPVNPSIANGSTRQFTATGTYSNGSTQDLTASVTWSSSSTDIATISNAAGSRGLATAIGSGTTTITATSGGVSGHTSLTVTGSGSVTVSWNAPTSYTDGSFLDPLTELQMYKLYYGGVSGMYTQVVPIPNPGTASVSQTLNLTSGVYYFAVTSVDTLGQESNYSNEVTKSL